MSGDHGLVRIEDVLEKAEAYCGPQDMDLLRRAYVFSAMQHKDQRRHSGEPYLVHPLAVADLLVDLRLDAVSVAVGLLHDVLEDTLTDERTLTELFGPKVARIVEGVTKISRIQFDSKEAEQAENFRKMLLAMVDDIRVILVKLCDRLHNMRTLGFLQAPKQQRIARETLEIYAPLANRLGMGRIKEELEDLAFRYLWPDEYEELSRKVEDKRRRSEGFIATVRQRLEETASGNGVPARVEGRVKRLYSIRLKMLRQRTAFDDVYDFIAFRVLTDSVRSCYGMLGFIHGIWTPIPGRFKDYVAMPKPNGYQSLHTTLMTREGQPFEVQIRTEEMHRVAEEGIAAHWSYKEGHPEAPKEGTPRFGWLRQLGEWGSEVKDPKAFMDSVKLDLYPDEVYTFTPRGQVMSFRRGATCVDFAYAIHTDVGHRCTGAKVNGKLVPLRTQLRNGDIVEVLTSKDHKPSRDWLKFVTTTRARRKIQAWLSAEQRGRAIEIGKVMLDRELKRYRIPPRQLQEAAESRDFMSALGCSKLDDLHAALGYGKLSARQVITRLAPELVRSRPQQDAGRPRGKGAGAAVRVKGHEDMLVSLARCCGPIRGEPIVGYITRGKGVAVHATRCSNVATLLFDPERGIDVDWAPARDGDSYQVDINVYTQDRPGMLARISSKIADGHSNIRQVDVKLLEDRKGLIRFTLEIGDVAQLEELCRQLTAVDGVLRVNRVVRR